MKKKGLIAVNTSSFAKEDNLPLTMLREKGYDVWLNPYKRKLKPEELLTEAKGALGLIAGTEDLKADTLKQLDRLKVISRCGTGIDNIDLNAAKELGLKIFNTPDAPVLAVAELTLGLILSLLRKIALHDREIRTGKWNKMTGNLLYRKKVGIVGFGRIGQKVGELLSAFHVEITYCDPEFKSCSIKSDRKSFEEILKWADIITLHLSFPKSCPALISDKELELMRKGSWLINISRGGVVDEQALYNALKNQHLAGAAIDTFTNEPYSGPLKELDNVVLTPHVGSYAREARIKMEIEAVNNLFSGLEKND